MTDTAQRRPAKTRPVRDAGRRSRSTGADYRFGRRLLRKGRWPPGWLRFGVPRKRRPPSGGGRGGGVAVELDEVVGGGDQAPFGADCGSAAAEEAVVAAVE